MLFGLLADLSVVLHLAFVLFVVAGGAIVVRRPMCAWIHLPAVAWAAGIEFAGGVCPLTPLENWFRQRAGRPLYAAGFVEHYLVPLLYPSALTWEIQWTLGALVLAVNTVVYAVVVRRRRQ